MSEMKEIAGAGDLSGAAALYPGVSKVTVDEATKTAYVFIGRGNQARVVAGEAFVALEKALSGGHEEPQGKEAPADAVDEPTKGRAKSGKKEK